MTHRLREIIRRNRAGEVTALPSVCSAHPDVLAASLMLAQAQDVSLIVEATSNQVNQFGGYTGMRPAGFVSFVKNIASEVGCDPARIIFGGDHLGPQLWKAEPPEDAMRKARDLAAEYVAAGFRKIHIDCAEGCAGEAPHLDDATVAARAADLIEICEATAGEDAHRLVYIIGTEVPPPGGARPEEGEDGVPATPPHRARQTLDIHFDTFRAAGLDDATTRVIGLVVQPGVEFSPARIDHLHMNGGEGLRAILDDFPGLCFEAHSTDYQHGAAYPRLAELGFAVQKIGPALTFAYRQAIYALDLIVDQLELRQGPSVRAATEAAMMADPAHWSGHYQGDSVELKLLRHFSYSDRIRYYWPQPDVQNAVSTLFSALSGVDLPDPLVLQFFSPSTLAWAGALHPEVSQARALVLAEIQVALCPYFLDAGQ